MKYNLPECLLNILNNEYNNEDIEKIINGYTKRKVSFRINNILTTEREILEVLKTENIKYEKVSWYKDAFIILNKTSADIKKLDIYNEGKIYLQSLSSMIPPLILNPKEQENILDMTASPGGKTTQLYALSEGKSLITAVEKNKIRYDRLKYNIDKQKASRVSLLNVDARELSDYFSFDKILLDAPCSGSGTIIINDDINFNDKLLEQSIKVQNQLLLKAIKLLKPNHEMIYSTCSILKEENEDQILKILKQENVEIVPIDNTFLKDIPQLPTKIKGTVCILPTNYYEGFFIAKLKKKK